MEDTTLVDSHDGEELTIRVNVTVTDGQDIRPQARREAGCAGLEDGNVIS